MSGTFWLIATARSFCAVEPAGRDCQRTVQPAIRGADGLGQAVFENVLAVKMRPVAVRRGHGVEHDQFSVQVALVQKAERRMQAESAVERQRSIGRAGRRDRQFSDANSP